VNRSVPEGLFSEFNFAEDPAMRPKPDADPKLLSRPKSRPWHRSLSSLTRLMTLVALSGLALAAYTERSRPKPSRLGVRNLMLRQQSPGFLQQSPVPSSVDPSIIVAPRGIDEAMIVTARVGIDEAMIVNPAQLRTGALATPPILPPAATGRAPLSPWPMAPQAPPPR
jgi:hypothetical protein